MEYLDKEVLVLGCGNVLFGDDGFGPCVVEVYKQLYGDLVGVSVMDVGISVREVLFNVVLGGTAVRKIIIIDAVDLGMEVGEVFELGVEQLPLCKIDDFSMHQMPTTNLLRELQEGCGIEVRLICAQVESIPEEVAPGLSPILGGVIPTACLKIDNVLRQAIH